MMALLMKVISLFYAISVINDGLGEFRNGIPHGQGILTYTDGVKYEGGFKLGKYHGFGVVTDMNGKIIHNGQFYEGVEYSFCSYYIDYRLLPFASVMIFLGAVVWTGLYGWSSSCATLYDGVVLQSYVLLIANTVFFMIFRAVSKAYIIPCLLPLFCCYDFQSKAETDKKKLLDAVEQQYQAEIADITKRFKITEKNSDIFFNKFVTNQMREGIQKELRDEKDYKTSMYFFAFTVLSSLVVFGRAAYDLKTNHQSAWTQYTNFYGLLMNSCLLTSATSGFRLFFRYEYRKGWQFQFNWMVGLEALSILLILPALLTHVLPGLVMYCWVVLAVAVVVFFVGRGLVRAVFCGRELDAKMDYIWKEFIYRIITVFLIQTTFNYASLVYVQQGVLSAESYLRVIEREYALRSETECLINNLFENWNNVVVFFNWIF